jgi:two-component system response regulator RegA
MTGRPLSNVLIVDDDVHLRTALRHAFLTEGYVVREAGSLREALDALAAAVPDLVICDVRLLDGLGVDIVRAATALSPLPLVIAISGKASALEAFQVAEAGARAYLEKPISFRTLLEEIERLRSSAPPLDPVLRAQVGHVDLKELGEDVRTELVSEAMARAEGNVTQAAKLLRVTRQAVQQAARKVGTREAE